MKRLLIAALLCSACLDGRAVEWPQDLMLGWQCRLESSALRDCVLIRANTLLTQSRTARERTVLLAFDSEQLQNLDPRVDTNRLDQFEITISPEDDLFQPELCARHGYRESDGRILRPLDSLRGHYTVYELSAEGRFEPVDPRDLDEALSSLSIRFPVVACPSEGRLELVSFAQMPELGENIPSDDPMSVDSIDDDHLLLGSKDTFYLLERGRDQPVWEVDLEAGGFAALLPPITAPWTWRLRDVSLAPSRQIPRRGLAIFTETLEQNPMDDALRRTAIVSFELRSTSIQATKLQQIIEGIEPNTPGRGLLAIEIEEDGGYVSAGYGLVVTSTSLDAAPRVEAFNRNYIERIHRTGDALYPHVFGANGGAVYVGNARRGASALEELRPFGNAFTTIVAILGLASRRDELGRTWIHVSSDQGFSARWIAGSEDFEELPTWIPQEDLECGETDEPTCGRVPIFGSVRALGVLESERDLVQLYSGNDCTGIFGWSLQNGCSISVSYDGQRVRRQLDFRSWIPLPFEDRILWVASQRRPGITRPILVELRLSGD